MEKEGKNQSQRVKEATDFVLQWGNRKRLRCCKVKKESKQFDQNNSSNNKSTTDCLSKKKIPSRVVSVEKGSPNRLNKNSDLPMTSRKPSVTSPEKEDRYYTTRGSLGLDDSSKLFIDHLKEEKKTSCVAKAICHTVQQRKGRGFHGYERLQALSEAKEKGQVDPKKYTFGESRCMVIGPMPREI